ncbi:hypothetical protein [Calidifontibacillus oryziterrae]|uniref:hypothetical protein n=1 Tax=Calidifontibacillus oryziterrae TaxID=1191699 RepID=UPI0002D94C3A|nr:hypothetical protein [Calidifontibacillus oryziterrae]
MGEYIIDFSIVAALIIGITALNGVLSNAIGTRIFGRGKQNLHVEQTAKTQAGWKAVGGRKQY